MIRHVAPLARVSWMATDWSMLRAPEARAGGPKEGPEAAEEQQQQPWGDAKLRDATKGGQTRTGTRTRTGDRDQDRGCGHAWSHRGSRGPLASCPAPNWALGAGGGRGPPRSRPAPGVPLTLSSRKGPSPAACSRLGRRCHRRGGHGGPWVPGGFVTLPRVLPPKAEHGQPGPKAPGNTASLIFRPRCKQFLQLAAHSVPILEDEKPGKGAGVMENSQQKRARNFPERPEGNGRKGEEEALGSVAGWRG